MLNLPVDCFLPSSCFTFLSISILIPHSLLLLFFPNYFHTKAWGFFLSEKIVRNHSVLHTYTEERNEKPDNSSQKCFLLFLLYSCMTKWSSLIKHTYKHVFCYTWRLWNKNEIHVIQVIQLILFNYNYRTETKSNKAWQPSRIFWNKII